MIAQPLTVLKTPGTAAVLQLNCRFSHSVTNSLFNDNNTANFLCIALQEPPIKPHSNTPSAHSGWNLIATHPLDNTEASRPRSCIYVNTGLGADIRPITCKSRDVSACTIKIEGAHILFVNVYNPPKTFDGFDAMDHMMRSLPPTILQLPTILMTDANLHSTLWNPDSYDIHDATADTLVEAMTSWDLNLRSPKGIVTLEPSANMASGTTIDLVWVNQQADDILVACLVDENNLLNHHSDHRAMVTVINVKSDAAPTLETDHSSARNWHESNQSKFFSELKA